MDRDPSASTVKRFPFEVDAGAGARARIGLLVLETDQTVEEEFRDFIKISGVSVYHARLPMNVSVTPETLARMADELPRAAALIPEFMGIKSLGYACTSAATIIGEDRVAEILDTVHPNIPSSNPLTAAKAALNALGVKRLGLLTPYTPDVTIAMQNKFDAAGINVTFVGSFYEDSDAVVGRISEASTYEALLMIGARDDVDGVFVSCTSLRVANIVAKAEAALGKPVTASNHALAWHLLRLAGIDDPVAGFGALFKLPLPNASAK